MLIFPTCWQGRCPKIAKFQFVQSSDDRKKQMKLVTPPEVLARSSGAPSTRAKAKRAAGTATQERFQQKKICSGPCETRQTQRSKSHTGHFFQKTKK